MDAVVTGGAGHIGSHLVRRLILQGARVTVVDDCSTGRRSNLSDVATQIRFVEADVRDALHTDEVVAGADVVYHLAAAVGVPLILENPTAAVGINLDGTRTVVDLCRSRGTRLVFASTSEVYGRTPRLPMREDDDLVIGAPTSPRWSYALAKALDEHLVLEAGRNGLDVTVLRYFNSYGPAASLDGDGGVVTRFIRQALAGEPLTVHSDGAQVRCFTFVDDVAEATMSAGILPSTIGQVINVGSAIPTTVRDLAELVRTATDADVPIVSVDPAERFGQNFDETTVRVPSVDRLRSLTGWAPSTTLAEGISRTVQWYREVQAGADSLVTVR